MRALLFVMVTGAMGATTCAFLLYVGGRLSVCVPLVMLLVVLLMAAYAARKSGEIQRENEQRRLIRMMREVDRR